MVYFTNVNKITYFINNITTFLFVKFNKHYFIYYIYFIILLKIFKFYYTITTTNTF